MLGLKIPECLCFTNFKVIFLKHFSITRLSLLKKDLGWSVFRPRRKGGVLKVAEKWTLHYLDHCCNVDPMETTLQRLIIVMFEA